MNEREEPQDLSGSEDQSKRSDSPPDDAYNPLIKQESHSPSSLFVKPTPEAVIRSIFGATPNPSEFDSSSPTTSPKASPVLDLASPINIRRSDRLAKQTDAMTPNPPKAVLENGHWVFKGSQGEDVDEGITPYDTRPSKAPEYDTLKKLIDGGKFPSDEQ
jgi:hypothetical protein